MVSKRKKMNGLTYDNSKTIGLVTLYNDNFGSILQAYSTYSFIESMGYKCILLELEDNSGYLTKLKKIPIILYKSIKYKGFFSDKMLQAVSRKKERNMLSKGTKQKMDNFVNSNFVIKKYNSKQIKNIDKEYGYFVTGSDQVWNGYSGFRFLLFASRKKRICLAPSFGTDEIKPYIVNDIKKGLMGFDVLTTREETGVNIIKQLVNRKAIRLPDPTVLYNKKEWEIFCKDGIKEQNYLLCHFLNEPNDLAITCIGKMQEKTKNKIICITNNYQKYNKLDKVFFLDVSPSDYVSLIDFADYVFTDSFHTSLFSINLAKQFAVFDRQHLHNNSQRNRITDLLGRLNLSDRFIKYEKDFEKLSNVDEQSLESERIKIREYILKYLNINKASLNSEK